MSQHSNPLELILSLSLPSTMREREGRKREIPLFFNHVCYAMV